MEDMLVLTKIKDIRNGPILQFPNSATMNVTKTGTLPLSRSLSTHTKKAHVFDGLQSAYLISLGQLCDNYCIIILDRNEINFLKDKKIILR